MTTPREEVLLRQVESLEYQVEELELERDALRAYCEELRDDAQYLWNQGRNLHMLLNGSPMSESDFRTWDNSYKRINKSPAQCLAELEARAVENALDHIHDGASKWQLKRHIKQLRENAKND